MDLNKHQIVEFILAMDTTIGNLERQLKDAKKQQSENESKLAEMMEQDGERSFTTESGLTVNRKDKVFITLRHQDKETWFTWLEKIGRGDLVKTDVNKRSFDAVVKDAIADGSIQFPACFNVADDLYFKPKIEVKQGKRSLRKAASDAGDSSSNSDDNF